MLLDRRGPYEVARFLRRLFRSQVDHGDSDRVFPGSKVAALRLPPRFVSELEVVEAQPDPHGLSLAPWDLAHQVPSSSPQCLLQLIYWDDDSVGPWLRVDFYPQDTVLIRDFGKLGILPPELNYDTFAIGRACDQQFNHRGDSSNPMNSPAALNRRPRPSGATTSRTSPKRPVVVWLKVVFGLPSISSTRARPAAFRAARSPLTAPKALPSRDECF